MSLGQREDYAADAIDQARRLALAPAATALLQLSGVLSVRASAAGCRVAVDVLERLDQRLYGFQAEGRDLTTVAIVDVLTTMLGEASAIKVAETPRPGPGQHLCQSWPCDNPVDCAKAASGEFCEGLDPHLCPSCQGDRK